MCNRPLADAPETQFCLVRDGELIATSFKPSADPDGGEWLPIVDVDNGEYDPAKHWRSRPLPLRLDAEQRRVVRVYPMIVKSLEAL